MRAQLRDGPRFSVHGSRTFETWLAARLDDLAGDVTAAIGGNLVALLLGGGYGRGEGAVVGPAGRERPYNDLDLLVVVRRPGGVAPPLKEVARRHRARLGIDVDFGHPLTVREIEEWEPRLRWHDLLHGHVVLAGDRAVLARHAPRRIAAPVPLAEAARLLLNRGAGLVWAMRVHAGLEPPQDDDFVRRNVHKALLAIGDAYIIRAESRSTHHAGRPVLLASLADRLPRAHADEIVARYAQAVSFKFAPGSVPEGPVGPELVETAAVLWTAAFLDIESERHGSLFATPAEYASWGGAREPQPPARWLRNLIANLRHGLASPGSPRELLYRRIPLLVSARAPRDAAWADASRDMLALWRRVND